MYSRNCILSQLDIDDPIRASSELVFPVVETPPLDVHRWLSFLLPGIEIVDITRDDLLI